MTTNPDLIRSVFKKLTQEQRDHIMSYFDKVEICVIEYEPGNFIACHMSITDGYTVLAESEFWKVGTIIRSTP